MAYTTEAMVRRFCGLDAEDAPDEELTHFITKATRSVIKQITGEQQWEIMSGDIDGSNKDFYTSNYPLADIDGDKTIAIDDSSTYGTEELEVYTWTDKGDITSRSRIKVAAVDLSIGKVTLSVAPSLDVEAVTCNYHFHTTSVDWELIELGAALLAGYMFALSEFAFIPETTVTGIRATYKKLPYERLKIAFDNIMIGIVSGTMAIRNPRKIYSLTQLESILRGGSVD